MFLKDNSLRARQILNIFYINAFLAIVDLGLSGWQYVVLSGYVKNPDAIDLGLLQMQDNINMAFGYIGIIMTIITVVFFIRWFRRAYNNLQSMHVPLSFSEGWAAGAWFVPFLNLVRPFQIMKEIWYETQRIYPHRFPGIQTSAMVGWWWTLYLAMNIGNNIVFRMGQSAQTLEDLTKFSFGSVIVALITFPAIYFAIALVKKISLWESIVYEEARNPSESIFGPEPEATYNQ